MQSFKTIKLNIKIPENIDFKPLDSWLKESFLLTIDKNTHTNSRVDNAQNFVFRSLKLSKEYLIAGRVPLFDDFSIISLENAMPTQDIWNVVVAYKDISNIPIESLNIAIEGALKTILFYLNGSLTDTQSIYAQIEKNIVAKIKKLIPAGDSTIPLLSTAHALNIPFFHLGFGVYQLGWGSKLKRLDRSSTNTDSKIGSALCQNKVLTASLLKNAGLPIPTHKLVQTLDQTISASKELGWPLVVKPSDLDRGEGVIININDEATLTSAFEQAQKLTRSSQVIVEKQALGIPHRFLVFNNEVVYAIKRHPKSILANGKNTIEELVRIANTNLNSTPPWKREHRFPLDQETEEHLKHSNLTKNSIVQKGTWISLRDIPSTRWGIRYEDVTKKVHPANVKLAVESAKLFDLDVAGVDIISPDITKPWYENGAIINEVNYKPLMRGNEMKVDYNKVFFKNFIENDGRIPIEIIIGKDTNLKEAKKLQKIYIDSGLNCYITNETTTLSGKNKKVPFLFNNCFERVTALLYNTAVDAIVISIQNDEFITKGLPVDTITDITIINDNVTSIKNSKKINKKHFDSLTNLCKKLLS